MFIVYVLITYLVIFPSSSCTPGSSYTVDCNTCVCDSQGVPVCSTNQCSSTTTSSTTSTSSTTTASTTASTTTLSTTTTTTTSTTSTTTASSSSSTCLTVNGPDTGSPCIFPFTFNSVTYVSCAEWVYGGEFQGQKWCSTKVLGLKIPCITITYLWQVDSAGVHVNGEGKYGICGTDCNPSISLAAILSGLGINTQSRAAQLTQASDVNFGGRQP